jgi:hypothetical protein
VEPSMLAWMSAAFAKACENRWLTFNVALSCT